MNERPVKSAQDIDEEVQRGEKEIKNLELHTAEPISDTTEKNFEPEATIFKNSLKEDTEQSQESESDENRCITSTEFKQHLETLINQIDELQSNQKVKSAQDIDEEVQRGTKLSREDSPSDILPHREEKRENEFSNKKDEINREISDLEYEFVHSAPGKLKKGSPEQEILKLEDKLRELEKQKDTPLESKQHLKKIVDQFRSNTPFIKNKYIWNVKRDSDGSSSRIEEYQPNQKEKSVPIKDPTEDIRQVREKIKDLELRVVHPVPGALKENLEPEILALEDKLRTLEIKKDSAQVKEIGPTPEETLPPRHISHTEEHQSEQKVVYPETSTASVESREKTRVERSLEWIKKENEKIDAKAERFGGRKVEKFLRYLGDAYNKQSKWRKIGIGLALGAGIAVGTTGVAVAVPFSSILVSVSGGLLTVQRTLATLGMFNRFEKHLDKVHEGSRKGYFANRKIYQSMANQPEIVRSGEALAMAMGYGIVSREVIGGAAHIIGNYAGDWLAHYFSSPPEGNSIAGQSLTSEAMPSVSASPLEVNTPTVGDLPTIETPAETNASLDMHVPNADTAIAGQSLTSEAMPSVSASPGHGYEWMVKRLWEKMHADGSHFVLPENTDPNSDLAQIYNANGDSIDKVVHRLASTGTGHGFYHADGTSVIINEHTHMTIGADNTIHISDATHSDIVEAPADAHTTPIYPQKLDEVHTTAQSVSTFDSASPAPVSEAMPSVSASPLEVNTPTVGDLPTIETPAETNASLDMHVPNADTAIAGQSVAPPAENHLQPNNAIDTNNPSPHSLEHTPEIAQKSMANLPQYPEVFSNQLNLEIDPTQGHIFEDTSGVKIAFANEFKARFEAAETYVQEHHDAVVWVQSNKLIPDVTDKNILRPYAFPVRWGGPLRGIEIPLPTSENPMSAEIGIIDPNSFAKELP